MVTVSHPYAVLARPRCAAGRGPRARRCRRCRRRRSGAPGDCLARPRRTGRRRRRGRRSARARGSRCSASAARAVRPVARRIDSATRRAARAASTVPPHTSGLVSAMPIASILAGLTARSRWGEQVTATSSRASATVGVVGARTEVRPGRGRRARRPRRELVAGPRSAAIVDAAALGVLARPASSAGGDDHLAPAAYRLGDGARRCRRSVPSGASTTTRSRPPAQPGEAGARPGDERHRAPRARARRAAAASPVRRRRRPGAEPRHPPPPRRRRSSAAASTASRRTRAPDSASSRSRWSARRQRCLVVEPGLVEQVAICSALRESLVRPACGPRRRAAPGCRRAPGRRSPHRCRPAPRRLRRQRAVAVGAHDDVEQLSGRCCISCS